METLARKLIARASGQPAVSAGDVVICKVDLAMIHDSGGPRRVKPMLERLGRRVWDRDRVVVVTDHYVPADTEETRAIQALTRHCLLYTSPSPRDQRGSRMPSSA